MNKIAIFGGAFDPVTLAHKEIGHLLLSSGFDQVWYMPCYQSLYLKQMSSYEDRVAMLSLMRDDDRMIISRYEETYSGSTYEMVSNLIKLFPDMEMFFVIGTDNANKVPEWKRGDELIKIIPFCVIARKGYEAKNKWFSKPPHIYLESNIPEMSSTDIREMVAANDIEKASKFIANKKVLAYLTEKRLYAKVKSHEKIAKSA
jgi:nicotinate-nucleotide adenylyltransferase